MKTWKKGAIAGLLWGILAVSIFLVSGMLNIRVYHNTFTSLIGYVVGLPMYIAVFIGARFYYIFLITPLIGLVLGTLLGYAHQICFSKGGER